MDDLTNDQKYILVNMYKHFLELQPGISPEHANYFPDSDYIQENFAPQFSKDYVANICWSLKHKEYISCYPGDDLANDIRIEDKTIIYMEHSFNRSLSAISSFLKTVIGILK